MAALAEVPRHVPADAAVDEKPHAGASRLISTASPRRTLYA
jgi:hypothetical protein